MFHYISLNYIKQIRLKNVLNNSLTGLHLVLISASNNSK